MAFLLGFLVGAPVGLGAALALAARRSGGADDAGAVTDDGAQAPAALRHDPLAAAALGAAGA